MSSKPRLYLIDGHALAYRTYFALTAAAGEGRFMTQSGEPTAGVYGFTSVLLRLLEQDQPEYLAVVFDKGLTFRDEIFPEYKATREKMPEDLRPQIERIRQIVQAFEIPILEAEGYEADDVLGTVAHKVAGEGIQVYILTGDRDLLQLANENTTIQLSGSRLSEAEDYGPQEVHDKYGIDVSKFVDYKALIGDKSDNIPGVYGVGEKTAISLLSEYEDLDEIYAHLGKVKTRFRNKLEEGREDAYLSRQLSQIRTDAPVEVNLEACKVGTLDREQISSLFRELEFRTLVDRLPQEETGQGGAQMSLFVSEGEMVVEGGPIQTIVVRTEEDLANLVAEMAEAEAIAFDVETTSTDAMQADLVGVSIAIRPGEGYYIPVGHLEGPGGESQLPLAEVLRALAEPLGDPNLPKVGHNLKYDYILLARNGLRALPLAFDTMIAEWLCDPASRNLGLKNLAWVRLGFEMTEIEELIGSGRDQRTMAQVPVRQAAPYAAADAEVCLRLMPQLREEMQQKEQMGLFREVEMPLVPILADMEMDGIRLDREYLQDFSDQITARLDETEARIHDYAGHAFNINSTQQLSEVLFEDLELKPPDRTRRTASGHFSTAASVLAELRTEHPIVDLVLEHREISKLKSTYADALPTQINPDTGRVHTSFNQTGSVTGRLASSDPNLQNIPIRTELGRQIRRAFVAKKEHQLLGVDYSQIELRVVAHMSGDQAMREAFIADQDIHSTTGAAVFGVELDDVTPEIRRRAKAINFGLIYGMSPYGLSRAADLTLAEAEDFVKAYFERFPGVERYLEETREMAKESGYVETVLGRRRYFPELKRGAGRVSQIARSRAHREAINAPIQGTASDIIKLAMLRTPAALEGAGLRGRMLLQVHDELVLECPTDEIQESADLVKRVMQEAYELSVPLKADAKKGSNWLEMRPMA